MKRGIDGVAQAIDDSFSGNWDWKAAWLSGRGKEVYYGTIKS
jgi:hypothetical protein